MLRNLGISLLLLGLLGATIDGFRVRENARVAPGTSAATGTEAGAEEGRVHAAEATMMPPS
jgi:hypothetical protein